MYETGLKTRQLIISSQTYLQLVANAELTAFT